MMTKSAQATLVLTSSFVGAVACQFPYPPDVADDDAPIAWAVGGSVGGLWTGGAVTLRIEAGDLDETVTATATDPFAFPTRVVDGTSYQVTVVDDGPDHDCGVDNGSGRVVGADVSDLSVTCTSLIPHGITISTAVPFTFDPRVTRYPFAVSLLQQEVRVTVTGPTLTSAVVAGRPVTSGQPSPSIAIGQGETTVAVELTKGALSRRYDLVFDRGATPIAEALYARAFNAGAGDGFGTALAFSDEYVAIGAPNEDSSTEVGNDEATTDAGAVYIYRRNGLTWTYVQVLKGSAVTLKQRFGFALAMNDDVLVVGAPGIGQASNGWGAAHVYRLDRSSGRWNEEQRLSAGQRQAYDRFGVAVAVSGDVIVVGSPYRHLVAGTNDKIGAVYSFRRSGGTWIEEPVLRPPAGQLTLAQYGGRVALDGDALVVNQFMPDNRHYFYRRSGTSWILESQPPTATGDASAIDQGVVAVGQPAHAPGGAVRVFTRSGAAWGETGLLKAASPTAGAEIGLGVALRGNVVVTAATPVRQLQVFDKVGGSWVPVPTLTASGAPADDPSFPTFGTAIAIGGAGAAVGASADGGPGNAMPGSGTVWFFR